MLLSTDGPDGNVIKVKPPMVFTEQNCFELLQAMDELLCELETLETDQVIQRLKTNDSLDLLLKDFKYNLSNSYTHIRRQHKLDI